MNIITGVIIPGKKYKSPLLLDMMCVDDQFDLSGALWELIKPLNLLPSILQKERKHYAKRNINKK